MKVSTKGRYALRMMVDIAQQDPGVWTPLKDISERQNISIKYLEQIATNLAKAGLLRSGRGSGGGYMLTKTPNRYTAGEILRTIEGELAPVACLEDEVNQCERCGKCKTLGFWRGLYKVIDDYVDSVTLEDIVIAEVGDGGNFSI